MTVETQVELAPSEDDLMTARDFRILHTRKATPRPWERRTEPLRNQLSSGRFGGQQRCNAIGLIRGDCPEYAQADSIYCYYHEKVESGLVEVYQDLYPVWPLPSVPWDFSHNRVRLTA